MDPEAPHNGSEYATFDVEGAGGAQAAHGIAHGAGVRSWPSSPASDVTHDWPHTEHDPLFTPDADGNELTAPSGRSAGGDILAGLRALTYDPLVGVVRAGSGAVASVMPQGLKDGLRSGADVMKDGLLTGAGAVKGGLVKTGEVLASVMPQDLKDGLRTGAMVAQRGASMAADAAMAGAAIAKDAAVEGAGVVVSVLPQEFRDVANVSREAVEKLAEASRAVERLLKDKAWRNYGGVKQGKKARGACVRASPLVPQLTCLRPLPHSRYSTTTARTWRMCCARARFLAQSC